MRAKRDNHDKKILLIQPPIFRKPKDHEMSPLIDEYWKNVNESWLLSFYENNSIKGDVGVEYIEKDLEPNLGLLCLAASIRNSGFKVDLIDFHFYDSKIRRRKSKYKLTEKKLKELIFRKKFDVVGISSLTPNFPWAVKISKIIKQKQPEIPIILGGIYPSTCPEFILKNYDTFDFIIQGEGELSMPVLLYHMGEIEYYKSIPGLFYKTKNGQINKAKRPACRIENFDKLPYPAYDLLPEGYKPVIYRILISRGCTYECNFCSPRLFWQERIIYRTCQSVIEQIEYFKYKYNAKFFLFGDLTFFHKENKVYEDICKEIIRNNLDINWWCQSRCELITKNRAKLIRKAGCIQVGLGIETANPVTREKVKKGNLQSSVRRSCINLKKNSIITQGYFIIGLPNEELSDCIRTIQLIKKLVLNELVDVTDIAVFVPFSGLNLRKGVRIVDKNLENYFMGITKYLNPYPVINTEHLTRYQIRSLWELAISTASDAHKKVNERKKLRIGGKK